MSKKPNNPKTYAEDPLYEKLLAAYQNGNWTSAKRFATQLAKKYPRTDEIIEIREDIDFRQGIEKSQREEEEKVRQKANRRRLFAIGSIAILLIGSYFAYQSYAASARERIQQASLEITLADQFRNAQNLLQSGRAAEAKVILEQVRETAPDYAGLEEALARAEELLYLDALYEEVNQLLMDQEYLQAIEVLNTIYEIDPGYKDVRILLDDTQLKANLAEEYRADADEAYEAEDWSIAVENYVLALNSFPDIQDQMLIDRLYESYLEAANSLLGAERATLQDLDQAEAYYQSALLLRSRDSDATRQKLNTQELLVSQYFSYSQNLLSQEPDGIDEIETTAQVLGKALLINPDDDSVQEQYALAKIYLAALSDYDNGEWERVLEDLEEINALNPDYADGTAKQLQYEALINLGNERMAAESYESAYEFFEAARAVAQENFDAVLPLYQAQIKMAQAQGEMEMFREAAILYREIVELTQLRTFPSLQQSDFLDGVVDADSAFFAGQNEQAYELYREALDLSAELIVLQEYEVDSADYLVKIAREHGSTVEALTLVNGLDYNTYPIQTVSLQIPIVTGE